MSFSSVTDSSFLDQYLVEPSGKCLAYQNGHWGIIQESEAKGGFFGRLTSLTESQTIGSIELRFDKSSVEKIDTMFKQSVQAYSNSLLVNLQTEKSRLLTDETLLPDEGGLAVLKQRISTLAQSPLKSECSKLLEEINKIFTTRIENALTAAVNGNQPQTVREILSATRPIDKKIIQEAFENAVTKGLKEVVAVLLEIGDINPELKGLALREAAIKGHKDVVEILSAQPDIPIKEFSSAFIRAAQAGHTAIVEYLLPLLHASLKQRSIVSAFAEAVKTQHADILPCLLNAGVQIDQRTKNEAFKLAAREGNPEIVQILISTMTIEIINEAFIEAASNNQLTIIEAMLKICKPASGTFPLNSITIQRAFKAAAKKDAIDVVNRFLNPDFCNLVGLQQQKQIFEEIKQTAFKCAIEGSAFSILTTLLRAIPRLPPHIRGLAIQRAAEHGHLDLVKELLADGSTISEEDRGFAVIKATKNGHLQVVKDLLEGEATISLQQQSIAINIAAELGYLEITQKLLATQPLIQPDSIGSAVIKAAENGHLEIVQELLADRRWIYEDDIQKAISLAKGPNKQAIIDVLETTRISSLRRFIDQRLIHDKALGLLAQDDEDIILPEGISFDTIYTWADQINWVDRSSPYYARAQTDIDGIVINQRNLTSLMHKALDKVIKQAADIAAPPGGTKEIGVFYTKLEYKIKTYILKILEEEAKLKEKIGDRSFEDLDEQTQKEFRSLCEDKARFCLEIGVCGNYCVARLNSMISQLRSERFGTISSDDAMLSLEDYLTKILSSFRLNIAKKQILSIGLDAHIYGAYMQSLGEVFQIPGAKDEIEHLKKFSILEKAQFAQKFSTSYSSLSIIKEIQEQYKDPKSQAFREKIQAWLQENVGDWNQTAYDQLLADLKQSITKTLEGLEGRQATSHRATDLFLNILQAVDPEARFTLDDTRQVSFKELTRLLSQGDISLDAFKSCVLSSEFAKDMIQNSDFAANAKMKNPAFIKRTILNELKDLQCDEALQKLAIALANKDTDLGGSATLQLQEALTRNHKIRTIQSLIASEGLTGVDCRSFQDQEAFDKSLKAAILVKQKSDYLEYCLGEGLELPSNVCERLLVSLGFLQQRHPVYRRAG